MPISKESTPGVISDEVKEYAPPQAEILPTERIDRATLCACKAWDDNPY